MAEDQGTKTATENQSGDPGRTPGSAEGDRETVEQDLEEKNLDEGGNDKNQKSERSES
jgi:hypothetical protein